MLRACFFTRIPDKNSRGWGYWDCPWHLQIPCLLSRIPKFQHMKGPNWPLRIQEFYPPRILVKFLNAQVKVVFKIFTLSENSGTPETGSP